MRIDPVAIAIHAFYPDVLAEMLGYVARLDGMAARLYVTCPPEREPDTAGLLARCGVPFRLLVLPNRGRDAWPFLCMLPEIISAGHSTLIKVHTKKSVHRTDGDLWRNELFESLLAPRRVMAARDCLAATPRIGVLGPADHLLPLKLYWGSNAARVESFAAKLGMDKTGLGELQFVAGTMFIARVAALAPLLGLGITEGDFETEQGQTDGTLAHAIERLVPVSARAAGLDTAILPGTVRTSAIYRFADLVPPSGS